MLVKVAIALLCHAFTTIPCSGLVCGNFGPFWLNDNQTCPPQAICGDVFTFTRDQTDGGRCNQTRILSNCLCPGNTVCPFHDESHALMSSATHRQYTCLPSCRLPWCQNVHLAPSDDRGHGGMTGNVVISMTTERGVEDFGNKMYKKVNCRCPQHVQIAPPRQTALQMSPPRYNSTTQQYSIAYVCNNRWGQNDMQDPCR